MCCWSTGNRIDLRPSNRWLEKLTGLQIDHKVVVLPETPHNLGLYYQRAGETMTQFLGNGLKK